MGAMIALNGELKMPKLDVKSDAKESLFAYTAMLEEKKKGKVGAVTKAVLSTAGKRAKQAKKETEPEPEAMDVDEKAEKKEEEKKEEEKKFVMLPNPARVTPDQEKHVLWE